MAVPGAGKTRSVREAASAVQALYWRERLTDAHDFVKKVRKIASELVGPPLDYEAGKNHFLETCEKFILRLLNEHLDSQDKKQVLVLHFDEVQLLMGNQVVGKNKAQSDMLFDYVTPAFGDAINQVTVSCTNLRVALSGTKFFVPLVFNSGSHLKFTRIQLEGGFPLDFGKKLLQQHFDLGLVQEDEKNDIIGTMCANRRAFQFFALELELAVGVGEKVSNVQFSELAESLPERLS